VEKIAQMIKSDFSSWHKLLCSGQTSTLDLAVMTIEALEHHCLPSKAWNDKTHASQQPKMYVLEQSFLDQVQFMAGI
jgi:hypothetical protein